MPSNVIDLGKIQKFRKDLDDIAALVKRLTGIRNLDIYNKISVNANSLFDKIRNIDTKNVPAKDLKELIRLLKDLKETCLILCDYKEYLEEVLPLIENKEKEIKEQNPSVATDNIEGMPIPDETNAPVIPIGSVVDEMLSNNKNKTLELSQQFQGSNQNAA